MKTKTYIKYLYSIYIPLEIAPVLVEKRDSIKHAKECSKDVFAFYYYDVNEMELINKLGEKRIIKSPDDNVSYRYYIDGRILTISDIENMNANGKFDSFIEFMKHKQREEAILCRDGSIQFYIKGDCNIITH
jgi:hypothetical protein